jgi:two-component system OmpR family sensor kinase
MTSSLWFKLVLAFTLIAIVAVGLVALLVNRETDVAFRSYIYLDRHHDASNRLADYYLGHGSWEGVGSLVATLSAGGRSGQGFGPGWGGEAGRGRRYGQVQLLVADRDGRIVSATDQTRVGSYLTPAEREEAAAIAVDGETVGWLLAEDQPDPPLDLDQAAFLERINQGLLGAAVVSVALALGLGVFLARRITRPLRELIQATQAIAAGDLEQRVAVRGRDEMAQLSRAFNQMAAELARNEELRRRMIADIAHELRTPISVIRGQLEAILDGVFPADAEHVAPIHERTILLGRLVEDLRTLALAEAGRLQLYRQEVEPGELVRQAVVGFTPLAQMDNLALEDEIAPDLPAIQADADRLAQVLTNLLSNALRHTPPGGRIIVRAEPIGGQAVRFSVADSGPGLTPDEMEHVFDRFWRADESRARDRGGAGLGLAIARQLVEAHGGRIWVESEPGQRATFYFEIPLGQRNSDPTAGG